MVFVNRPTEELYRVFRKFGNDLIIFERTIAEKQFGRLISPNESPVGLLACIFVWKMFRGSIPHKVFKKLSVYPASRGKVGA